MGEVGVGIQPVFLGRFHDAIDGGAGAGSLGRVTEDPILPTNHKRLDRTFRAIVAYFYPTILKKAYQLRPLIMGVLHSHTKQALSPDYSRKMKNKKPQSAY